MLKMKFTGAPSPRTKSGQIVTESRWGSVGDMYTDDPQGFSMYKGRDTALLATGDWVLINPTTADVFQLALRMKDSVAQPTQKGHRNKPGLYRYQDMIANVIEENITLVYQKYESGVWLTRAYWGGLMFYLGVGLTPPTANAKEAFIREDGLIRPRWQKWLY